MVQTQGFDPTISPSTVGAALLQQQFHSSPYWSLRHLVCIFDRGCVTVRGTLPSYYLKQVAQSIAMKALGNDGIQSDIDVQSE
jgi:hypothetical protein